MLNPYSVNSDSARAKFNAASPIVFLVFLAYYVTGSLLLPYGAGPDNVAHFDGADFVYREGRLATLPRDEEQLHFTAYGSTRVLRPPLIYLTAAAVARVLDWSGIDRRHLFRFASALLGALTILVIFSGLRLYFSSSWYATSGAMLAGLLPQFSFISSHLNDDSAAIFSVSLLVYCMILLLRKNLDGNIALLTGLAFGLVILSKFTAWLFLPFALLGVLAFSQLQKNQNLYKILILAVLGLLFGGGWWLIFNIYHYGWTDPLLFKISAEVSEAHRTLDPGSIAGFSDKGIGLRALILGNYQGFLGESLISTIGNLDWLRLRLGAPQYLLYAAVIVCALLCFPLFLIGSVWRLILGRGEEQPRQMVFFGLLFSAVIFQFFMYSQYNLNREIQIQGKYLLPVLFGVLLLFLGVVRVLETFLQTSRWAPSVVWGNPVLGVRTALLPWLSLSVIALVHLDALTRFVIPFYVPSEQAVRVGRFTSVDLTNSAIIDYTENLTLQSDETGWRIFTQTNDPQILFKEEICKYFHTNNVLRIDLVSDHESVLQVFWDKAGDFVAKESVRSSTAHFYPGLNHLVLAAGTGPCVRIRLDPTNQPGRTMSINGFAIAPLSINRMPFAFPHGD